MGRRGSSLRFSIHPTLHPSETATSHTESEQPDLVLPDHVEPADLAETLAAHLCDVEPGREVCR